MENLPIYIPVIFVITTVITLFFVAKAFGYSKPALAIIVAWLGLQAVVASTGFYTHTSSLPPRFMLTLAPPLISIILFFITSKGRKVIDAMPASTLTLLHVIRIPVEIILLMMFINKTIPGIMTFEGRNFDIISGISAPVVYYFAFVKRKMNYRLVIAWNILCLALLVNIVTIAVLAAPFPFQQLAFDQPNIAVLYAPYVWLPAFIVPAVLFSHLVVIRKMLTVAREIKISNNKELAAV